MVDHIVAHSRRVKRGIKTVRPMKAPTFENAYLDRARRTNKKKSCRHKKLLIIRLYDTRLQPQNFLRQHAWRQQRVAQRTRSKEVPTATNERRVAAVADRLLLGEFNGDPIDPWNTSSVTNMYDWEAVVFNQPISQWQIKLATSCK